VDRPATPGRHPLVGGYTAGVRRLLAIASLLAGCGLATDLPDSSVVDAADGSLDLPDASTVDAAEVDTPHASFRVVIRERFALVPAEGFSFRAETADGQVIEGTIDAHGWAPPSLDAFVGRWDLTVARTHYPAVSILGIDGPLHGDVLVPFSPAGMGIPTHVLTVSVDGAAQIGQPGVFLCPSGPAGGAGEQLYFSEGATSIELWAIQRTGNVPGDALVNFVRSGPIALGANDFSYTLHMPPPSARVLRSTVRVQFPSTGLLTPDLVIDGYGRFWRGGDDEQLCTAANASWAAPDATGIGRWTIDTFDVDGVAPTTLAMEAGTGVPGFSAAMQIHTAVDGALVTIAPVTRSPLIVDDGGWPRLQSNGSEIDHLQMITVMIENHVHTRWDAYTFDATTVDHRLPSLPTGMRPGDLVEDYGFGLVTTLMAELCGLRVTSGPPPWAPGSSYDLRVCDSSRSVRFGSP
jgi:hypothetical protein